MKLSTNHKVLALARAWAEEDGMLEAFERDEPHSCDAIDWFILETPQPDWAGVYSGYVVGAENILARLARE